MADVEIPWDVLLKAKEIAIAQGYLPVSPCVINSNQEVVLCAAACLADAGLLAKSDEFSIQFRKDLSTGNGNLALNSAYTFLEWPTALCETLRVDNDSSKSGERLGKFLHSCDNLARTSN